MSQTAAQGNRTRSWWRRQANVSLASTRAEQFVPIRQTELVELLCDQPGLSDSDRQRLRQFCARLSALLHRGFRAEYQALKDDYAPFDPDRDTQRLGGDNEHGSERIDRIFERVSWLLQRANYRQLSRSDLEAVLHVVSDWGVRLHVDLNLMERLEVFARGDTTTQHTARPRWPGDKRLRSVEIPTFRRLAVAFRFRGESQPSGSVDPGVVYLKLFKNIPHTDLEMLLPGTRVRMSWIDRGKILVPTASGLAIVGFKIVKGALTLMVAGIWGMLAFLGLVAGAVGLGMRSYHRYEKTVQKYQLKLSQNLYYQNLDNNAGVMARLFDEAEEQEFREALLAWYFLWREAPADGWPLDQLDRRVELFLHEQLGQEIDFEVGDALQKLRVWRLIDVQGDERIRPLSLEAALENLDRAWREELDHKSA